MHVFSMSQSNSRLRLRFVFSWCVLWQKCLNGQIETCLLGTRWYNFGRVHRPGKPQCAALQMGGRQDDANSRSYRVALQ